MEEKVIPEEVKKEDVEVKNLKDEVVGHLSVEESNEIVSNLVISGIHFKEVDILGVKFTFKTLTKAKRAEVLKKVSGMNESEAMVGDYLTILNLSSCLESIGKEKMKDVEAAVKIVNEMEEHVFSRVYDEYLLFMFEVQAAVYNKDAVKNSLAPLTE